MEHVLRVLEKHKGNKPTAAAELRISLETLDNRSWAAGWDGLPCVARTHTTHHPLLPGGWIALRGAHTHRFIQVSPAPPRG